MLFEFYFPKSLSPARLDRYLAGGWFRGTYLLYRSKLICLEGDIFTPVEIRLKLEGYEMKKRLRKLFNRNMKQFAHTIGRAVVNAEKEKLYQGHKHRFKGFVLDSLDKYLYGDLGYSCFDTWEICVYDGDKLIGVSFFDVGDKSIASLLSLYDADYHNKSIGLYTMLLEVEHAMLTGKKFYYPGYVLDRETDFDYKLRLGEYQYYNWKGRWCSIKQLKPSDLAITELQEKMKAIEQSLSVLNVPYEKYLYPLFSMAYFDPWGEELMKSVVYLSCYPEKAGSSHLAVEYLMEEKLYQVSRLMKCYDYPEINEMNFSNDLLQSDQYSLDLMSYEEIICRSADPETAAQQVLAYHAQTAR